MSDEKVILENRTSYDHVLNIPTVVKTVRPRKVRMADPDNEGQFVIVEEDVTEEKITFQSIVLGATTPQGLGWAEIPAESFEAMVKSQPVFEQTVTPVAEGGLGKISVRRNSERMTARKS